MTQDQHRPGNANAPSDATATLPRRVVLVIDDDELDRVLVRRLLSREFEVREAHNLEAAIEALREPTDLVLLDNCIGLHDSASIAAELGPNAPPIIVYSGQLSPALQRREAVAFHREHGIVTQAWGPLGGREGLGEQFALRRVAEKHGVSTSQISLRWAVDQDIVVIPKSQDPTRQRTNATLEGISLDDEDRALLASLDLGEDAAWDSREHEEW